MGKMIPFKKGKNYNDQVKEGEFAWDKLWKLTDEQAEKNENMAVKAMANKEGSGIFKVHAFYKGVMELAAEAN